MNFGAGLYMGLLGLVIAGAGFFTYTGALLPNPDENSTLSLKDVETRRTHFVRNYAMGK